MTKPDALVYVTIYHNNNRLPAYHFEEGCKRRKTSLRLPTIESEARKLGLRLCTHCRERRRKAAA